MQGELIAGAVVVGIGETAGTEARLSGIEPLAALLRFAIGVNDQRLAGEFAVGAGIGVIIR